VKILIAGLCASLLWSCSANQITAASGAVSSAAPSFVNDGLIVAQIEGYFLTIDADSALQTKVAAHNGVVRLSGRVKSASVRDRFVARAKTTPYVTRVVATLTIDPHVPSAQGQAADFGLTVAVEANLASQAGVNALPIHVEAHGGVVTLHGNVHTPALRETMVDTTKKTAGVRSVIDRLAIEP
jgi:osmotically-inducible protein OsmY